MATLLYPLSNELRRLRRELETRLSADQAMSSGDVRRIIEHLTAMETEAVGLEGRPEASVSASALDLARRLQAAGISG
jgi:hypothetical protein